MSTVAKPESKAEVPLDFGDFKAAYKDKTLGQLTLALAVLQFSSFPGVARYGHSLLKQMRSVLGDAIVLPLIEKTFFAHFCAGEDQKGIAPRIAELRASGVGSILDYAAEEDVPEESMRDLGVSEDKLQSRTYAYVGEEACDENLDITLSSIRAAASLEGKAGFAAVKVTSLGVPQALQHLSQVLMDIRAAFLRVAGGAKAAEGVDLESFVVSLPLHSATLDKEAFVKGVQLSGMSMDEAEAEALFHDIDADGTGTIDFVEWLDYCNPRILGGMQAENVPSSILPPGRPTKLTPELQRSLDAMLKRAERLAQAADEAGVTIMFDAEQTYMQPAIDHIVWYLQRQYNIERPVVFNTYQAYLKDCPDRMSLALDKARKHGYKFGAKLVRGAYRVQEAKRAEDGGYPNPIQPNIQATHDAYDWCLRRVMESIADGSGARVMVASHNEASIQRAVDMMGELGISRKDNAVFFGQLLGMCDHVSFTLGAKGFAVYKYVPYGPVGKTIPYLIRRAQENGDLLAGAARERKLLRSAILHRLAPNQR